MVELLKGNQKFLPAGEERPDLIIYYGGDDPVFNESRECKLLAILDFLQLIINLSCWGIHFITLLQI